MKDVTAISTFRFFLFFLYFYNSINKRSLAVYNQYEQNTTQLVERKRAEYWNAFYKAA